ncbi:MAG TPA: histidine phosphatase family protein [Geothrix sp.]|nr:histidine phosphatase family protein [Geothrix sp.]
MSTTSISTLRHARTAYNEEKRYAGSIDVPLSDQGRKEAAEAAMKMKGLRYGAVVTSRLCRARETAECFLTNGTPLVQTRLCNERRFGILEGLTWDDVQTLDPPILMISVGGDLHTVNPRNGEPFEAVWERAHRFRRFLFRRFAGQKVLVISHGVFLQMFHGVLRGSNCIEALGQYPANLELRRFDFTGGQLLEESAVKLSDMDEVAW